MSKLVSLLLTLFVLLIATGLRATGAEPQKKESEPKLRPPTDEQLAAAHEAYVKLGASYQVSYNWRSKKTTHAFRFPRSTIDNDLDGLIDLPFAFALNFGGVELTDAVLKKLKNLKNLTELTLWGAKITDAGLKELKEFKNLTCLNLWATHATQAGVDELQEAIPKCEIIYLGDAKPTDILKPFEPIPQQLEIAKQAYEKIGASYSAHVEPWITHYFKMPRTTTDADLKHLPNLPFRFGLDLEGTRVTDAGLRELIGFKSLSGLVLTRTDVTDAGLKSLSNLGNLTRLRLDHTRVTDAGLIYLIRLKKLTRLDLGSADVTDAGLPRLKELNRLTHLDLGQTKVTDAVLNELIDLDKLGELNLFGTGATDAGVKELQGFLPRCKIWK